MLETSLMSVDAFVMPPSHILAAKAKELLPRSCKLVAVLLSPESTIPAGFIARLLRRSALYSAPLRMLSMDEDPKSPTKRRQSHRLAVKPFKMEIGAMNMEPK